MESPSAAWERYGFVRVRESVAMGALAIVVGVLAARNVAADALVPPAWYVPANLAVAALLALIAWRCRLSLAELGLSRAAAPTGLAVGAAVGVVMAAVIVAGAAIPLTRPFFEDERIAAVDGGGELAYQALVRIPLGTALLEELAFRGVLLAFVARLRPVAAAVIVSSLLFGLWHIHPTLGALASNDVAQSGLAQAGAVAAAVVLTAAGGVLFCGLRLVSGSLAAPLIVHAVTNGTATVAAYVVLAT
jgi:membrane protease YdiL (CAAX protease family)